MVAEEVEREAGEEEDDECDRLADDVTEDRRGERARFVAVLQHFLASWLNRRSFYKDAKD